MIPLWPLEFDKELDTAVCHVQVQVWGPIYENHILVYNPTGDCWDELYVPWYRRYVVAW